MQLKILQYYKIVSNIATNLLGAFIPLIILQQTGNLWIALLYWIAEKTARLLFSLAFHKLTHKRPQILIMIRTIPLIASYICILYLTPNNVFSLGLVLELLTAFANSCKTLPQDMWYNYVAMGHSSRTMGFTRMIDSLGVLLAQIIGGYFLDSISKNVIAIIAIIVYIISFVPMLINYIATHKNNNFNQEYTTDATEYYKTHEQVNSYKNTKKSVLAGYTLLSFLTSSCDDLITILNMYLFLKHPSFLTAGIYASIHQLCYGAFSYIWGLYGKYHNTRLIVIATCFATGIIALCLPFCTHWILISILCGCFGICYASIITLIYQQSLDRTEVLGCKKNITFRREYSGLVSQVFIQCCGLAGGLLTCFFAIGFLMVSAGVFYNINDERSRKKIVDFIHQNDIH